MINIGKILKQSWHILWNYRVLWAFGILLALTTGGGSGGRASGNSSYRTNERDFANPPSYANAPEWAREFMRWFEQDAAPIFMHPEQHVTTWVWIGIAFFLFILIVSVIVAVIRYPTETAVMRMVDEYEQTGSKVGFRQGWKLGWSRRAFRMWLIDLIVGLPAFAFISLMLVIGLVIYFSATNSVRAIGILGLVAAIGIFFLALFIFIVVMVVLGLLRNFFARTAALEDLGVVESFRKGWAMFKGNWKSAGLMWLVMIGIGIAYGILAIFIFFLLIPAYLIMLLPAGVVAFFPGLLAFGITSLFASGPLAWIIGILTALPFFFTVLFAPLLLVGGWYKIFESNVWTLTYREIKALASLSASPALPIEDANLPLP
jgi:hypothetical protein